MKNLYQNLFAGVFVAVGIGYEAMALSMPVGGFGSPGPGLFPLIVGGALVLSAAACLIQNLVRSNAASTEPPTAATRVKAEGGKAWLLVLALILYVLVLKPLGFPIALVLLLAASMRVFGYRKWLRIGAMSILMTAMAHVVFVTWLKVPLPLGILAGFLG